MPVKFRTEFYGEGGHSPAEILAYECFELQNIYLIEDLLDLVERYANMHHKDVSDFLTKAHVFYENITKENNINDYQTYIPFMSELLEQISYVISIKIEYLLWLTEFETVLDIYGSNIELDSPESIINSVDAYESGFLLIEIPYDGILYAYSKKPEPLPKSQVQTALNNYKRKE